MFTINILIGKSTTITLLAKELGLHILQWNHNDIGANAAHPFHLQGSNNTFTHFGDNSDSDTNQFSSLEEFLHSASLGYHSIVMESNSLEPLDRKWYELEKKTSNALVARKVKPDTKNKKSVKENVKNSSIDDIESEDDEPVLPEKASHRSTHGMFSPTFASSSRTSTVTAQKHVVAKEAPATLSYSSIILMEELPTLNTVEREEQFRYVHSSLSMYYPCSTHGPLTFTQPIET